MSGDDAGGFVFGVWIGFTYRIAGKVYVNGRLMVCFDSEVLLIR